VYVELRWFEGQLQDVLISSSTMPALIFFRKINTLPVAAGGQPLGEKGSSPHPARVASKGL